MLDAALDAASLDRLRKSASCATSCISEEVVATTVGKPERTPSNSSPHSLAPSAHTQYTDDPSGSRLFVVCGNVAQEETTKAAFEPFGNVEYVRKVNRESGAMYVKFDKASSGAKAIEHLNLTSLNQGRGPQLKVFVADPPAPGKRSPVELSKLRDVQYVKTDLVTTKGIAFVKFSKASSALLTLETLCTSSRISEDLCPGMLCGHSIKCGLADPKTRRPDTPPAASAAAPMQHVEWAPANRLSADDLHSLSSLSQQLGVSIEMIAAVVRALSPHNDFANNFGGAQMFGLNPGLNPGLNQGLNTRLHPGLDQEYSQSWSQGLALASPSECNI
eukprot:gene14533-20567_t